MSGQRPQPLQSALVKALTVRGVDSHGGIDKGELLRQGHRRPGALQVTAGVQDQFHAPVRHGGEHLHPVAVEGPGVIVGMGIENGHGNTSLLLWYGYSNTVLENKKGQTVNFPRARQKEKGHPLGCPFNQHDQPIWFSFRVMALLR